MNASMQQIEIASLLVIVGLSSLIATLLHYVRVGWKAKRKDIMDGLGTDARLAYFHMFSRSDKAQTRETAGPEFERIYDVWYGRQLFVIPGILLFLVGLIATTSIVFTGLSRLQYMPNPFFDLPDTAMAAMAGAYLWVVDDHVSRARRLDFAPSDVMWGVLRLLIAIPMGYAFASLLADSVGPFVAFALGAFPLTTLTSMIRTLFEKRLALNADVTDASDDIIKLQGVNKTIVERLFNEGITTVTQIAYCDPVRLVMRSSLTFNFVTDCMNSALAWMYLQESLDAIRPLGLRGAVEIKDFVDSYNDPDNEYHKLTVDALPLVATALKQDPVTVRFVFVQIAEDPFTVFLSNIWS